MSRNSQLNNMTAPFHTETELTEAISSPMSVESTQLNSQVSESGVSEHEHSFRQVLIPDASQGEDVSKKRPLNSWILYRTFYSEIFHNFQQAQISSMLQILWSEDPFKAKWAILAKAYSMIKDKVGKENAPLNKFLNLCCPEIGIISVNKYLEKLKWCFESENDGKLAMYQSETPDLANFETKITGCFMTEIDVIEYCVQKSFFPDFDPFVESMTNNPNRLMAVTTPTRSQNKEWFFANITADPKAVAAHILGWDINHEFLKISTDLTIPAVKAAINMAEHPRLADHLARMRAEHPRRPEVTQLENQVWTGSMSELYRPTEASIDFDSVTAPENWGSTDIGNPAALDESLQTAGYDTDMLNPDVPADTATNLTYTFGDSF